MSFLSLIASYFIRFENNLDIIKYEFIDKAKLSILIYLIIRVCIFFFFKIYQGLIRYTSLQDIKRLFLAIGTSSLILFILNFFTHFFYNAEHLFPTSILIMEFFISFSLLMGIRFMIKVFYIESSKNQKSLTNENIIIYGAGVSGLITKRTIEKDNESNYNIIGFIDDNKKLSNTRLQGSKIFHSSELETLISKYHVNKLIIAIQKPNYENQQCILDTCIKKSIRVLQVPSSKSWIDGDFTTSQIKNFKIDDLLGRNPIYLNADKIASDLENQIILVTGAAGSIGSGIVKQLASYLPKFVILLDQAESDLYDLEQELH